MDRRRRVIDNEHPRQNTVEPTVGIELKKVAMLLRSLDSRASERLLRELSEPLRSQLQTQLEAITQVAQHEKTGVLSEFTCFVSEQLTRPQADGPRARIEIVDFSAPLRRQETARVASGPSSPESPTAALRFEDVIELDEPTLDAVLAAVDRQLTILAIQSADARWKQRILDRLSWSESKDAITRLKKLPPINLARANQVQQQFCDAVREVVGTTNVPAAGDLSKAA